MKGESLGTARRGRGKERSNRTIGPREILARSPVPSPRARAHARRYLAQRDKSLVPHVIKSFSRSRGSKGKERRTLEKAGREAGGWHTTDLDSAALCASVDDKGRSGGRTGGKRRLNGVKPRAGDAAGREGEGREGNAFGEEGPTRIFITERGAPGRTGIGAAMNVGNYLSCIAAVALLRSWKSPPRPRVCGPLSPARGGFEDAWVANRSLLNNVYIICTNECVIHVQRTSVRSIPQWARGIVGNDG